LIIRNGGGGGGGGKVGVGGKQKIKIKKNRPRQKNIHTPRGKEKKFVQDEHSPFTFLMVYRSCASALIPSFLARSTK